MNDYDKGFTWRRFNIDVGEKREHKSMELIEVFWFFLGAITMLIGFIVGSRSNDNGTDNVTDQSMDEGANVSDNSKLLSVCGRDRCRSGDSVDDPRIDREEALTVLDTLRVGASGKEKAALDYSKDCIDVAHKLAEYWKG